MAKAEEITGVKLSDIEVGSFNPAPKFTTAKIFPDSIIHNITKTLTMGNKNVISGKVIHHNIGSPSEGLPIFFGSNIKRPKFVAYTDSNGSFSFSTKSVKVASMYLYVGGHIEADNPSVINIFSGASKYVLAKNSSTSRYSLSKLDAEPQK